MIATEKVTVTLPTELIAAVRSLAPARRQSQFIAAALRAYIAEQQQKTLRERLIAGYQSNASADAALAAEWAAVEDEIGNRYSPTVIVAAITSGGHAHFDVNVVIQAPEGGLANDSLVLLNQIRTVDKTRLGRYWGHVPAQTMVQVDEAIKISLGLVPL